MPKRNDKVFCTNHPDEEMINHGPIAPPYIKKDGDGRWGFDSLALYANIYECSICQYVEIYSLTADEVAFA